MKEPQSERRKKKGPRKEDKAAAGTTIDIPDVSSVSLGNILTWRKKKGI